MAAEEKTEKTEASGAASSSGGGGGKVVMILTAVNTIAVLGMVGILLISFQKEKKHASVEDISAQSAAHEEKSEGGHGEKKSEHGGGGGEHGAKKKSGDFGKMITLDQFTVNLSTPGSANPKFVRVNISLEAPSDDLENEVTLKMPQVRNVVIDLFNSKRPSDLATPEGRDYLKEEIKNAINAFLVGGKIRGVFFTNFALSS